MVKRDSGEAIAAYRCVAFRRIDISYASTITS